MHTFEELDASDFEYRSDGSPVPRGEVMPHITPADRVGVVMGSATEGIDAGNFVLSCVTAFYDHLRATTESFYEYPDFYTFQTTDEPADYGMLDIYPDHKNVAVEPAAEQLARAIVDRAITVLLVPTVPSRSPDIADITRRSVERRVEHCYQYAGSNQLDDADFAIELPRQPAEAWYVTVLDSVTDPSSTSHRTTLESQRNRITQRFSRLDVETALSRLPTDTDR